ncbi:MAG TPA: OsmC family protein [Myxococcales bacterium]|nr:OsmC family protein [Myxococcales bacterium]
MSFEVETQNLDGRVTTLGRAGTYTLVIDRPEKAGGGGLGFNGGELLHLAVAGCISNDLFREAQRLGVRLRSVNVKVRGGFAGDPAVSTGIEYDVGVSGDDADKLRALVKLVDEIAEIPNSLRRATPVKLVNVELSAR